MQGIIKNEPRLCNGSKNSNEKTTHRIIMGIECFGDKSFIKNMGINIKKKFIYRQILNFQ